MGALSECSRAAKISRKADHENFLCVFLDFHLLQSPNRIMQMLPFQSAEQYIGNKGNKCHFSAVEKFAVPLNTTPRNSYTEVTLLGLWTGIRRFSKWLFSITPKTITALFHWFVSELLYRSRESEMKRRMRISHPRMRMSDPDFHDVFRRIWHNKLFVPAAETRQQRRFYLHACLAIQFGSFQSLLLSVSGVFARTARLRLSHDSIY